MRVLHVHSGNLYGGVETFLVTLAHEARLAPAMSSSFALCFEGRFSRELRACGHVPHTMGHVRLRRPDTIWRARHSLAAILRDGRFDVAVCHQAWPYAIFGPAIRRTELPLVLWLHSVSDKRDWLDRLASRTRPDLVVCNSRFTAGCISRWFQGTPIEWVHCPLRLSSALDADRTSRNHIRRTLATSPDDIVMVQVGRLETLKGHRDMLTALSKLRDLPPWKYWIVGGPQRRSDQHYLHELQRAAHRLGLDDRVRFIGERTDVPVLLRAADMYCQPNARPEAFGLSLVEALAAGLPVVTSGIGGACEIVDETCGVLTPPEDVEALASAIRRVASDSGLRARLGAAAAARPEMLCNAPRQMRRIEQLLSSIVRSESHARGVKGSLQPACTKSGL
jgi:glycosyltransferase involved in cell wall biosynthesis